MKVQLNNILTTLNLSSKPNSQLEQVVLEYGSLVQRMSNIEQESWFFKKARENNLIKIKELKNTFSDIREAVNSASIDDLIHSKNSVDKSILKIKKMEMNSIIFIGLTSLNSRIAYIEELMEIKSRVDKMNEIDFYFENTEHLIKLLGW